MKKSEFGLLSVVLLPIVITIAGCSVTGTPEVGHSPEVSSDAESDTAAYAKYLAFVADFWKVENPPSVEIVKWIAPEDRSAYTSPCLRDEGFTVHPDGSWEFPAGQESAFALANYKCWAAYPPLPQYTLPWSDEQISIQYDWTIEKVIPCLEEHGYTIVDVPTRQVFIDTYTSDPFYPFAQLPDSLSNEERNGVLEVECPQIAPSGTLFPDG